MKAILWDMDGTLYSPWRFYVRMTLMVIGEYWKQPALLFKTLLVFPVYQLAQELLRRMSIPVEVPIAEMQIDLTARISQLSSRFVGYMVYVWLEERPLLYMAGVLRPDVEEFLRWSKSRGIRSGVVSDYPAWPKLEALGIAELFDVVVTAQDHDVNEFKPGIRGFQKALTALGVPPEEVVYIGNSRTDRRASRTAGIRFLKISRLSSDPDEWERLLR